MIYLKTAPFNIDTHKTPKDVEYDAHIKDCVESRAELDESFTERLFEGFTSGKLVDENSSDIYEWVTLEHVTCYLVHNGQRYISDGKIAVNIDSLIEDLISREEAFTNLKTSRENARPRPIPKPSPPLVARKRQA